MIERLIIQVRGQTIQDTPSLTNIEGMSSKSVALLALKVHLNGEWMNEMNEWNDWMKLMNEILYFKRMTQ